MPVASVLIWDRYPGFEVASLGGWLAVPVTYSQTAAYRFEGSSPSYTLLRHDTIQTITLHGSYWGENIEHRTKLVVPFGVRELFKRGRNLALKKL